MDLRQPDCFEHVAELGRFTHGAQVLQVPRPASSRRSPRIARPTVVVQQPPVRLCR
jgi:hypothetical protein